jgi:hypothetical protein
MPLAFRSKPAAGGHEVRWTTPEGNQIHMLRRILLAMAIFGPVTGCTFAGGTSVPTAYPASYIPTVIYLTAQSIDAATVAARPPTETPTATPAFTSVTLAPTLTPTSGLGIPLAAIQIKAPGPMSRVVSPLQIQMLAIAGDSKKIDVDLFGEDGSLLGHNLQPVAGSPDGDPLTLKIRFEIRGTGERGYIQVSTKDAHGRVQSLVTVPILLLSDGSSQINPAGNTIYERVALSHLPPDATATGGLLAVEGQFQPYNRQLVILELITDDGRILSTRVLSVSGSDWQSFSTTLPYKIDGPTPARLFVHEGDDVLTGQAFIYSQPITLSP